MAAASGAPIGDQMVIVGSWLFGSYRAGWWFMLVQAFTVFLALIGTTLSCLSTGARVTYAMGREGEVGTHFGLLHGKTGSPHRAIWTLAMHFRDPRHRHGGGLPRRQSTPRRRSIRSTITSGTASASSRPTTYTKLPNTLVIITLISNFGTFLLYMMTCLITIVAFREHDAFHGFKHVVIPVFGLVANLACMLFYLIGPFMVSGMSWQEPYIALGVAALWGVYGVGLLPALQQGAGQGDHPDEQARDWHNERDRRAAQTQLPTHSCRRRRCSLRRDAAAFCLYFRFPPSYSLIRLMEVICTERSVPGPVRPNNEDLTAFFQPDSLDDRRTRGIVAILADGVGGEERGEIASRLAVDAALQAFREAAPETAPAKLLGQMFNAANLAVYDAAHHGPHKGKGGMSTTLAVSLFRHDEVAVAHVGDTRIYHLRGETLTRLTTDHSYVSLEVKLGLVSERDAMTSRLRSVLTRSVGHDHFCRVTYGSQSLERRATSSSNARTVFTPA